MSKIVIALGGNALGNNPEEQKKIVKITAKNIVDIIDQGHKIVIVHGNGPQVGMINLAFDIAHKTNDSSPIVDFPECGSMSQGYIGYHLQNAIFNEMKKRKIEKNIVTLITQTLVDKNSRAFKNPTKPIGSFYSKEEAKNLIEKNKWTMVEDSGRGYRRVIASPEPIDVIEKNTIKELFENGSIVIAGGGGGIPVYEENNSLIGVPAVIDKDFTAAKIGEIINADKLIILTAVDAVKINFGKVDEKTLKILNKKEAQKLIDEGQFGAGSMLPKVKAAISFLVDNKKESIIGSLNECANVIKGISGTIIK